MSNATYEGWKNRQTWNVALWINNEYALYQAAVEFMKINPDPKNPYKAFILNQRMEEDRTPDGYRYWSMMLNYEELNEMMKELIA